MELALFIYLANLVGKIEALFVSILVIGGILYSSVVFVSYLEGFELKYKKTIVSIFTLSALGLTFIPSERTMYLMAAGYAGQTVVQKVGDSESINKVQLILNNKLDEIISKQQKNLSK